MIGAIGGLVMAVVTVFKKEWAAVTAPMYALLEGLVLESASAMFERVYPSMLMQAVALTFGTAFCMLVLYRSGVIRVTQKFTLGVVAATGGIALFYLVTMQLGLFPCVGSDRLREQSPSIGFQLPGGRCRRPQPDSGF